MSTSKKHISFLKSDCISEQMMFDYIDNRLRPKEQHQVEKHLIDCELCSDALDGLRLVKNRNRIRIVNQKVNEKIILKGIPVGNKTDSKVISINYKIIFAVAAGLLLLLGSVFFFNQLSNKEMKESVVADLKTPLPLEEKNSSEIKTTEKNLEQAIDSSTNNQTQFSVSENSESKPDFTITEKGILPSPAITIAGITKTVEQSANDISDETSKIIMNAEEKKAAIDETKNSEEIVNSASETVIQKNKEDGDKKTAMKKADSENVFYRTEEKKQERPAKENNDKDISGYAMPSTAKPTTTVSKTEDIETVTTKSISKTMSDSVSVATETLPEFPGGNTELTKFISSNFHYPATDNYKDIPSNASILAKFTVDNKGKLKHYKIIKGVSKELNSEALRLIGSMPKWKPATKNGEAMDADYILTIPLQQK